MPVTIWVDADAVPRDVKEIILRAAARLSLPAVLVSNQRVEIPAGAPNVTAVRVAGGPDVADRHIAEHSAAGDVCITQDIPLAAQLVAKRVHAIDPRGSVHTEETIGERLSVRDFMEGLRGAGVETGGPKAFGPKDKQAFASALDRVLTRAVRDRP